MARIFRLAMRLAISDVRLHYRRTTLGPLWMSLTLLAQVLAIGLIFSGLFSTDLFSYLLFLASGFVMWTFLTTSVNEAASSLSGAGSLIKQVALPPSIHILRVVIKNVLILGHNIFILVPFFLLANNGFQFEVLQFIPGLSILLVNVTWISIVVAVVSARFRDVPAIVSAVLTLSFYVTPILWRPEQLVGSRIELIVYGNPLFHILQVARDPLLGNPVSPYSLVIASVFGVLGLALAGILLKSKGSKISFWV